MINKKILVTGAGGMLGSAICNELESHDNYTIYRLTREKCNLLNEADVLEVFTELKPDIVFHCAAKVGGIAANKTYPVEFLLENTTIQNNVFKAAYATNVDRLLFFASNAIYPSNIDRPLKEEDILAGPPEETVRPYALAKLSGVELCYSYNKEYGTNYISLIPINLYGPNDNFHPEKSHVLPALIRKFHHAVINNKNTVEVWGTGNQRREFMCSLDLARIACEIMQLELEKFSEIANTYPPLINIGVGCDISIKDLATVIAKHTGFTGKIIYNADKPEGIRKKCTDIEKMTNLGLRSKIPLDEGIGIIYDYFVKNIYKKY